MSEPPHLVNAARTLERILNARDPENVYTVSVRPDKGDDTEGVGTTLSREGDVGSVSKYPRSLSDRNLAASADRTNQHHREKAA